MHQLKKRENKIKFKVVHTKFTIKYSFHLRTLYFQRREQFKVAHTMLYKLLNIVSTCVHSTFRGKNNILERETIHSLNLLK